MEGLLKLACFRVEARRRKTEREVKRQLVAFATPLNMFESLATKSFLVYSYLLDPKQSKDQDIEKGQSVRAGE